MSSTERGEHGTVDYYSLEYKVNRVLALGAFLSVRQRGASELMRPKL